jgi:Fic family protein
LLNARHGMTGSKIHFTWLCMHQRCNYPKHKSYVAYGGRGITICERWNSFEHFYADMGEVPARKTLDRKDNNKGYSPENCRWASNHEQANNKRNNFKITGFGRKLTLIDWSRETGLSKATITYRLAKGMSPEVALSTPPSKGKKLIRFRKPIAA